MPLKLNLLILRHFLSTPVQSLILSVIAVGLTYPAWYPQFDISVDGSCAWLYNHFWANDRPQLAHLIFPHGPLDFLQTPLPIGSNLGWALVFNAFLRLFFIWTGLLLVSGASRIRFWGYFGVLVIFLKINMMDVLVFATTAHTVFLATQKQREYAHGWLAAGAMLSVLGLLVKTIIGLPCVILFGTAVLAEWMVWGKWKKMLAWAAAIPVLWAFSWVLIFGNMDGFGTMLMGTFWLSVGNSAAVCHYPPNNWWVLGAAVGAWYLWPVFHRDRQPWLLLALPVFAFWKYGFSREDIWHLDTTFRVLCFVAVLLVILQERIRWLHGVWLGLLLTCFYVNLQYAEGWSAPQWQGTGWENGSDWLFHFEEKRAKYLTDGQKRLERHILPDSVRSMIGDKTVDVFPWHYSYAAANGLHLSPRHIPQSYAAYTPWLDQLDAAFFSGAKAPDFLIFHLKPYNEGGQLKGLDERYLLHDAPNTILQIANRYTLRVRHPQFLLLEKTNLPVLLDNRVSVPYTPDWRKKLPETPGIVRLKGQFKKSIWGRIRSFLFKDEPVFMDVQMGNIVRRIKIVPALAPEGIWLGPWIEQPSLSEPYRLPDAIRFQLPDSWTADTSAFSIEWQGFSPHSGWLPASGTVATQRTQWVQLQANTVVAPDGFSEAWVKTFETPAAGALVIEAQAGIRAPHNNYFCSLVVEVKDATGHTAHYASSEYYPMGIGTGLFWPVGLRTTIPKGLAAPYTVKVYVWNTCKKAIEVNHLSGAFFHLGD